MSRSLLCARERSDNTGEKLGRGNDVEGEVGEGNVASHMSSYVRLCMIVSSSVLFKCGVGQTSRSWNTG